jgi:hypothetical protein
VRWPFGRRKPNALDILKGAEWICGSCSERHLGMFDLACDSPGPWTGNADYEPNSELDRERDFLSEDFCVLGGEHFLIRCVLEIPVHGLEDKFGFGCWGSLKRDNFETYVEHFDAGTCPEGGPWWSWLCNRLGPLSDDQPIGCWMFPQLGRQRPVLDVDDEDHPLALAQRDGISAEQVLAIYAHYGHAPRN